jgi:pimeloyl-ACP methyl ester carboxylesterase
MLRHIVAWNLKEGATAQDALQVKAELEGLLGKIEGLLEIKVHTNLIGGSNRAIALNSLFEGEAALAYYQTHPEHVRAAAFVASVTCDRACIDYIE